MLPPHVLQVEAVKPTLNICLTNIVKVEGGAHDEVWREYTLGYPARTLRGMYYKSDLQEGAFFQFPKIDTFVNFHGALLASLIVIS